MVRESDIYFAYGSNLCREQMAERCPDSDFIGVAYLPDHRLTFPMTAPSRGNMGVAGIAHKPGDMVWGALYRMTPADWEKLDACEHVGEFYNRIAVNVFSEEQDPVAVQTYFPIVENPFAFFMPSTDYMNVIVEGARDLGLEIAPLQNNPECFRPIKKSA